MNLRKHFLEAATLVIAALLCALVANAFASRERKITVVGSYPNALKVPAPAPETAPVPPIVETTMTTPVETTTLPPVTSSAPPAITATGAATTATQPTTSRHPAPGTLAPTTTTSTQRNPATPQPSAPPSPSGGTAAALQSTPTNLSKYAAHPDKQYIEITYADVAALHAGGALFLDARRTNIYEQGHIPGARSFSVWESDVGDKVKGLWEQRQDPKEQALPIVIYCSGGDCEDSHMLSEKLWGAQFSNIYVYKDGFPDWVAKGGKVRTGGTP
jgi:rhodanese-related sulfurtransferase